MSKIAIVGRLPYLEKMADKCYNFQMLIYKNPTKNRNRFNPTELVSNAVSSAEIENAEKDDMIE